MTDKRNYIIKAEIRNAEVRACELVDASFTTKEGKNVTLKYLDIKVDDENGDRIYLRDNNLDNESKYTRGKLGTFKINIEAEEEYRKSYKIYVTDFVEKE